MGQEYENVWPKCGCTEKCAKSKCVHAGGRALAAESLEEHGISDVGRKNSPARMKYLLDKLMQFPNVTRTCALVGITYSTLKYWLKKSETGQPGDGFDLEYSDETKRFHEHYVDVRDAAVQMVEDAYVERAIQGYYETLHHQGRVAYQYDQELLDLGMTGPEAFLRDDKGRPIPERIHHQDPEVMLSVLKAWRKDRYSQHSQLDVLHRGGVMVVTAPARTSAELEARERQAFAEPLDVEFVELKAEGE